MEERENSLELIESSRALDYVPKRELEAWWFLVVIGGVMVLVSVVLLLRRRRITTDDDAGVRRRAYEEAVSAFGSLDEPKPKGEAVAVSLILRGYLAKAFAEPALFETHEELVGRSSALSVLPDGLREELATFFRKLAGFKYAPDGTDADGVAGLRAQGLEFLERIHQA